MTGPVQAPSEDRAPTTCPLLISVGLLWCSTGSLQPAVYGLYFDWKSIAPDFYIQVNGGPKFNADDNVTKGNYNMFLEGSPLYDVCKESNASSHEMFKKAFPEGFAWELLELMSGPPRASFTWRHWAKWTGDFNGVKGTGETLEMIGSCVVEVDSKLKIKSIDVYYDPNIVMAKLTGFTCRHLGK
ncbi:hypothetical protein FSP39_011812 [Pinctada imbricata]|uniref:Uncharacterized protein n=1 Tax=Pinctada imbricata TaxID=66713 RepID=A0AA88XL85_PINIB|nr:hypothetical protein FSP39_011812 [Pinctada imbricata]